MENKNHEDKPYDRRRSIGEMVIARRKELNWTQDDLEYYSEVSVRQISRIESNQSRPSMETIEKLEKALGISLVGTHRKSHPYEVTEKACKEKHVKLLCKLKNEAEKRGLSDEDITTALEKTLAEMESEDE